MTDVARNLIARQGAPAFSDPLRTADGSERAQVPFDGYETLWLNTGTLCNLACANCYIESTPTNDALVYLTASEVRRFLDELSALGAVGCEVGFTGGEPFMNPEFLTMLEMALAAGHRVLVLTNAMQPMRKCADELLALNVRFPGRLTLRVSVDHPSRKLFAQERGAHAWTPMVRGLKWLSANSFDLQIAARSRWDDSEAQLREQFSDLFADNGVAPRYLDSLVIFPEMGGDAPVPEITTACWGILGKRPEDQMCSNARMVVHRRGEAHARVTACTLLPYAAGFDLGATLEDAARPVSLNHRWCAQFCVLGGGSCS